MNIKLSFRMLQSLSVFGCVGASWVQAKESPLLQRKDRGMLGIQWMLNHAVDVEFYAVFDGSQYKKAIGCASLRIQPYKTHETIEKYRLLKRPHQHNIPLRYYQYDKQDDKQADHGCAAVSLEGQKEEGQKEQSRLESQALPSCENTQDADYSPYKDAILKIQDKTLPICQSQEDGHHLDQMAKDLAELQQRAALSQKQAKEEFEKLAVLERKAEQNILQPDSTGLPISHPQDQTAIDAVTKLLLLQQNQYSDQVAKEAEKDILKPYSMGLPISHPQDQTAIDAVATGLLLWNRQKDKPIEEKDDSRQSIEIVEEASGPFDGFLSTIGGDPDYGFTGSMQSGVRACKIEEA